MCKVSVGVGKEEADRERQREGMKEGRKNKFGDCLNFYFLCFSSPRLPQRQGMREVVMSSGRKLWPPSYTSSAHLWYGGVGSSLQ